MDCDGMRMRATGTYGESCCFHSTEASSIGMRLAVGLELNHEIEGRLRLGEPRAHRVLEIGICQRRTASGCATPSSAGRCT